MDPDSDPAIFVIALQDANRKNFFIFYFFCLLLFKGTFPSFFKDKMSERVKIGINFCMMIDGSGSIPMTKGSEPGSPKTCGSGSES
jgi:hypothetical protein